MKHSLFILAAVMLISAIGNAQQKKVQPAFTLTQQPAIIEGMAYDKAGGNFYFGDNNALKILRYSTAGKPNGFIDAAKAGMAAILGMTIDHNLHELWVCSSIRQNGQLKACMFQFDLNNGRLIKYYPDSAGFATMFNDVTITADGNVYTTQPDLKALYKVNRLKGTTEQYLLSDSLADANGICSNGNAIFISTSRGFAQLNTQSNRLQLLQLKDYRIAGNDGLYYYNGSLIGIQNVFFPVTIGRYYLDEKHSMINKASVLVTDDNLLNIPTTGTVVGNYFYFMANTNLLYYDFENRHILQKEKIKRIRVMKIKLAESD